MTRARTLLDAALHLAAIPDHPVAPQDIDLFHTVARVLVLPGLSLGFPPTPADLVLDPKIEQDGKVRLRRPVMPAMLSRDLTVIRQDCVGSLLKPYNDQVPGRGQVGVKSRSCQRQLQGFDKLAKLPVGRLRSTLTEG